jgi:putative membrane protein
MNMITNNTKRVYTQQKDDLILRDFLAADRTVLANERTFLAYIRTALSLLVTGVSFVTFSDMKLVVFAGFILIPVSIVILLTGVIRFCHIRKKLAHIAY